MGALLSIMDAIFRKIGILSPRDDDDICSTTGLKGKEKRVMTQTWKLVRQNLKEESILFFELLFTEHPDYIEFFPSFRGKKLEEFNTKANFKAHAKNVFYAVTLIVDTLYDADELVEVLLKTGRDHYHRGVPIDAFHGLAIVFDKFMAQRLGNAYTPLAKVAWVKALGVVNAVIEQGMNQVKPAANESSTSDVSSSNHNNK